MNVSAFKWVERVTYEETGKKGSKDMTRRALILKPETMTFLR